MRRKHADLTVVVKVDKSGKRLNCPGLCDTSESGIRPIDLLLLDLEGTCIDVEYRVFKHLLDRSFLEFRRTVGRFAGFGLLLRRT